ncbi:MAG: hypothetical protein IJB99_06375 [Clostridia bacterium]|nr:hypothetical protein [Clostridia bacterium]
MQNTIKTLAQLGDLYATLTSSIPGSVVSNLVLMILERVDPNEQKSYANKMKKLAIKGYPLQTSLWSLLMI